jgi:hypothetical protein
MPEPPVPAAETATAPAPPQAPTPAPARPKEIGGPTGPEPTRYGDWERKGRCIDF